MTKIFTIKLDNGRKVGLGREDGWYLYFEREAPKEVIDDFNYVSIESDKMVTRVCLTDEAMDTLVQLHKMLSLEEELKEKVDALRDRGSD